jgi:hypothetical protein
MPRRHHADLFTGHLADARQLAAARTRLLALRNIVFEALARQCCVDRLALASFTRVFGYCDLSGVCGLRSSQHTAIFERAMLPQLLQVETFEQPQELVLGKCNDRRARRRAVKSRQVHGPLELPFFEPLQPQAKAERYQ